MAKKMKLEVNWRAGIIAFSLILIIFFFVFSIIGLTFLLTNVFEKNPDYVWLVFSVTIILVLIAVFLGASLSGEIEKRIQNLFEWAFEK
jgi:hypothetical protein